METEYIKEKLPQVSQKTRPPSSHDKFWLKQFGANDAFMQLSKRKPKSKRRQVLPGCKLQPIYKNNSAPPRIPTGDNSKYGSQTVLPGIEKGQSSSRTGMDLDAVFTGTPTDLPIPEPTMVRVYLASNIDDMYRERDVIFKKAVPQVQEYCSLFGLTFQLVDLNWCRSQNDFISREFWQQLRSHEIAKCRELSAGPNFVVLVGDKYGSLELPLSISEEDFTKIKETTEEKDQDCLNNAYSYDECGIYTLDATVSNSVTENALNILKQRIFLGNGDDTNVTLSSLEHDVVDGVINTQDPRNHCLCYHREYQHVRNNLKHPAMATYFNLRNTENGNTAVNTLMSSRQKLIVEKLAEHLGPNNKRDFYVPWFKDNHETSKEHKQYLDKLVESFVTDVKHLVDQALMRIEKTTPVTVTYKEVLFHRQLVDIYGKGFYGQEETLFAVEKFLKDPRRNHLPYVIHGKTGSGLTGIVSHISSCIPDWFSSDVVVAVRLLGKTSQSSSIHQLVIGLILQICYAYGIKTPEVHKDLDTHFKTLQTFRNILTTVSTEFASTRPLCILLDGIHQIQPLNEALQALWAIRDFPQNISMVITVVSNLGEGNMLDNIVSMLTEPSSVYEMGAISDEAVNAIVEDHYCSLKRDVPAEHKQLILSKFKEGGQSLSHLQHLIQMSLSGSSVEEIPVSTLGCLETVVENLEDMFGIILIQHALSYITISNIGINERELLDLLTCSEEVNMELKKFTGGDLAYHVPPWIWCTIKFSLQNFLEERLANDKVVLCWKHFEYNIVINRRYGTVFRGIPDHLITVEGTGLTLGLHEDIIDRYLENPVGISDHTIDPMTINGSNSELLFSKQPTLVANQMKLTKLPEHMYVLIPVEGVDYCKESMWFNITWLLTKVSAAGGVGQLMKELLQTIQLARSLIEDETLDPSSTIEDLELLHETIQVATPVILQDSRNLLQELLGRLMGFQESYPFIQKLVQDAQEYITNNGVKALLPIYGCLTSPDDRLRHILDGPTHIIGVAESRNMLVTFSEAVGVDLWSLDTGERLQHFKTHTEQLVNRVTMTSNEDFVVISYYSHLDHQMELSVWSTITGLQVVKSTFPNMFEALALEPTNRYIIVATMMPSDDQNGAEPQHFQRCLIGVESKTREVLYKIPVTDAHNDGISKILLLTGDSVMPHSVLTIGSKMSKDLSLWDLDGEDLKFHLKFDHFPDLVEVLDAKNVAVCGSSSGGVVYVVDLRNGLVTKTVSNSVFFGMTDIYVSKHGDHLIVANQTPSASVFSLVSEAQAKMLTALHGKARACKVTMDNSEVFAMVGYSDGSVEVFLVASGKSLLQLEPHTSAINSLLYTGTTLISTSQDCKCHVYHIAKELTHQMNIIPEEDLSIWDGWMQFETTYELRRDAKLNEDSTKPILKEDKMLKDVIISPRGEHVVCASAVGKIRLYESETGDLSKEIITSGADKVYFSATGSLLMAHCLLPHSPKSRRLQMWNSTSGAVMKFDEETSVEVICSSTLPDDNYVITVIQSSDASEITVKIFDLFELKWISGMSYKIPGNFCSDALKFIGGVTLANHIHLTEDDETNQNLNQQNALNTTYMVMHHIEDGGPSQFYTFKITNRGHPTLETDYIGPMSLSSGAKASTLLPTGKMFTGCTDGTLYVWNIVTSTVEGHAVDPAAESGSWTDRQAHKTDITCVVSSQSGNSVASGDMNGLIKVWNTSDITLQGTCVGHVGQVDCLAFSAEGNLLASGGQDQKICLWKWSSSLCLATFHTHDEILNLHLLNKMVIAHTMKRKPTIHILRIENIH